MSSVRFVRPTLKLAAQLKTPGGLTTAEALEAAHANLAQLRPPSLSTLQALAAEAEACLKTLPATFSREPILALYAVSARGVGLGAVAGAPAADDVLVSLCDLLDRFLVTERWDRDAAAVHVSSLRLLVLGAEQEPNPAGTAAILDGLKRVHARHAERPIG